MNIKSRPAHTRLLSSVSMIVLIMITASLSGCLSSFAAYVPSDYLDAGSQNGWTRDPSLDVSESQYLGLMSFTTYVYRDDGRGGFSARLSVSTLKTITPTQASDALITLEEEIASNAEQNGIVLGEKREYGSRDLANGHNSVFFVYEATAQDAEWFATNSGLRIRGEVWSSEESGTAILCVGYAVVSTTIGPAEIEDYETYNEMINDIIPHVKSEE